MSLPLCHTGTLSQVAQRSQGIDTSEHDGLMESTSALLALPAQIPCSVRNLGINYPGPALMKRRSLLFPKLGKLKVIEEKVPSAGPGLELVPTNLCGI